MQNDDYCLNDANGDDYIPNVCQCERCNAIKRTDDLKALETRLVRQGYPRSPRAARAPLDTGDTAKYLRRMGETSSFHVIALVYSVFKD